MTTNGEMNKSFEEDDTAQAQLELHTIFSQNEKVHNTHSYPLRKRKQISGCFLNLEYIRIFDQQ
jgi:hypothetical protein